jgi:hypothetical protein
MGAAYSLERVYLAQGERRQAVRAFQKALARQGPDVLALSGLEEAYDDPEEWRSFCRRFREEHPAAGDPSFVQWFLEPAQPDFGFWISDFGLPASEREIQNPNPQTGPEIRNPKSKIQNGDWVWQDPFGDSSRTLQNGLAIHAANGRDLWWLNRSAPRLLRPVAGAFAIQTVCIPLTTDKPAIGGVLLWKDQGNFLRLDRGALGPHEVSFQGCLGNQDVIIGRGRLPAARLFLRLERQGPRVNALCSADGQNWFTVGHAEFPVEDPLEVGLHAIGNIDRTLYHGAYPEGTAIRFESFDRWTTSE